MPEDFGFKGVAKQDFSDFEPKTTSTESSIGSLRAADRTADRAGFRSREPVERVRRLPKAKEPLDHAYVRGPVSLINRFKNYCNEEGISYGQALERLMEKAGL